jgi:Tat protein secretion system quality control protein TatD with DNase activity
LQQSMYPNNVPSSLPMVLDQVVECLQQHDSSLTREQVADQTTKNAKKLFGWSSLDFDLIIIMTTKIEY